MKFTRFPSLLQPIGTIHEASFSGLCEMLAASIKNPVVENGAGWSAATFSGNKRSKKFCEFVYAIVLDFDDPVESAVQLSERWKNYQHAVYTTKSNNHDTLQRLRLILPLSTPIAAADYPRLWAAIAAHEKTCDIQCKDPSRFWFWPSSNHPENAKFIVNEGDALDPTKDFVSPSIERAIATMADAPNGARNATLNKVAFALASNGQSTNEIKAALTKAAKKIGLSERETEGTLQSATSAPLRSGAFTRGDHAEIAEKIIEQQPNIAHDGLSFFRCTSGVWSRISDDEIAASVLALAGSPVLSKNGASQLKINQSTIVGVTAIVASKTRRDFSKATPGVTFKDCRLTIKNGVIVSTKAHADDLEKFAVDFDYDENAYGSRFNELLTNIFEKMDDPRLLRLQEFAGACLFSQATQYQKCLVLLGSGGNGKSQLITAISSAFPALSVAALPAESWGSDFRLSALVGKRLNSVNEMPQKESVGSERFKNVVTGEPLCIDVKYRDPVTVALRAGHLFAANQLPITTDHTDGFFRRFLICELTKRFDNVAAPEREFGAEIARNEKQAVACWCVRGMARLLAQGGFTPDPSGEIRLAAWATESDSVKQYATELTDDGEPLTKARELYRDYYEWAREGGMSPVSEVKFAHRLKLCGYEKKRFTEGMFYRCRRK